MKKSCLIIFAILAITTAGYAADTQPYIGYIYPAGGRQGSKITVLVGGQKLWSVNNGIVSGSGVKITRVTVLKNFPNPSKEQRQYLQNWIKAILNGHPEKPTMPEKTDGWHSHPWWDKLNELTPLELDLTIRDLYIRRDPLQSSPSISQLAIVEIDISQDAALGSRELRLCGQRQISVPLTFMIDNQEEFCEPGMTPIERKATVIPPPTPVKLPAAINGQIMPGEIDRFSFTLKKDERYTFILQGRSLHPFLGDAVPGHFQPVINITDDAGHEVAFADDWYFNPDPILTFQAPREGTYTLAVRDSIYRGREDFVYRITATPGDFTFKMQPPPEFAIPYIAEKAISFTRKVTTPIMIAGTIAAPGKPALYTFDGNAGEELVIEVFARRLGSPLDSKITLFRPDGNKLAENDDAPALNVGQNVQHVDSRLRITLPQTGIYRLQLSDTAMQGGPDFSYYLRIDQPHPDFRVYSSRSNLAVNGTEYLTMSVERLDNFTGEITIVTPEKGFIEIAGVNTIPPGSSRAAIVFRGAKWMNTPPSPLILMAQAEINGQTIRHPVIAADEVMQAFAYYHLLPTPSMYCAGASQPNNKIFPAPDWRNPQSPVNAIPGQEIELSGISTSIPFPAECAFELVEPPSGVLLKTQKYSEREFQLVLQLEAKMKPGSFNLIIKLRIPPTDNPTDKKKKNPATEILLPTLRLNVEPAANGAKK